MTFLYYTLLTLLLVVAVLLILLILIQKGRGGGLSSAFGGGGGSSAFGAKTGDVLTWATSIVFGVFILLAVSLDLVVGGQYKNAPVVQATLPTGPAVVDTPTVPANVQTPATTSASLPAPGDINKAIAPATQAITTQAGGLLNAVKSATKP